MNTVRSVGYGWFVLVAAGGGAYFFAKKSINADREARHNADVQRRAALQAQYIEDEQLQYASKAPSSKRIGTGMGGRYGSSSGNGARGDNAGDPSVEASSDPAPTRHAPVTEAQRVAEKSKYEASEVWRSKKGDRFS